MALIFFSFLGNPRHELLQILGAVGGMFGGMAWFGSLVVMITTLFHKPEESIESELRSCTKTSAQQ